MARQPQTQDKYIIRLPDGLRGRIQEVAKAKETTMNTVIVQMLETAVLNHEAEQKNATPMAKAQKALDRIQFEATELEEQLSALRLLLDISPQLPKRHKEL